MDEIKIRTLFGIFFVSAASLSLEISLTRYFSISQNYHFAFLVISIAFLGYGASGSFFALFKQFHNWDKDILLTASSLLFSLFILLSFFLANSLPFDFFKLLWDKNQVFFIFFYYVLLSLPFFFAGLTISSALTRFQMQVNKIYFFDLLGAGIGAFLGGLIFLPKGEKGVFILISCLALLGSILFSPRRKWLWRFFLFSLLAAGGAVFLASPAWLNFRISPFKDLPLALKYPQAQHLLARWNAISRIDVIRSPATRYAPGLSLLYQEQLPPQLGLSVDGGELSAITQFQKADDPALRFLSFLPSSLAYSFVREPKTLIIEPKGGLDVLEAIYFKASQIKVIESNPLLVSLFRRELAEVSNHLYHQKNIQVDSGNSRALLKKEKGTYDLIVFSLTDVLGASGTGLYGLAENYLFTVNSFAEVLNKLSSSGVISLTLYLLPPPRQEIKVLATWVEALERLKKDPSSHLVSIRSWATISYFIKKSPFGDEDIKRLKAFCEERLFDLVYYPGIEPKETNLYNKFAYPIYSDFALEFLSLPQKKELYKNYTFDVQPATDNRPFFSNFYKLSKWKETYRALGQKWLPLFQGKFLIPLLLVQSLLGAFILILLPVIVLKKNRRKHKGLQTKVFFYFTFIGMGFIFVEIILVQKFILFLGHPLYSISTILFSLLFSSGVGSLCSRSILRSNLRTKLRTSLFLSACLITLDILVLPAFCRGFIGLGFGIKVLLAFLFIFPLGFLMGFPFPTGIRLLGFKDEKLIPWAWAVNSFSSVVNSVMALMIAFWGGYNFVLGLASLGYLLAIPFLHFSDHGDKANF
jgi:hypothetical protein